MIQAENSIQTSPNLNPNPTITTQVHGFAKPIQANLEANQNSQKNTNTQSQQELHPYKQHSFSEKIFHWWHKIAILLLTLHGLTGLWESIKFIAVDFKELEHKLDLHLIDTEEVNHLISKVIIVIIATMINVFMAVRLSKVQETTAHNVDLILATIIIIGTKFFQTFLIQFDLLGIFLNLF